jgi:hypothetical protein
MHAREADTRGEMVRAYRRACGRACGRACSSLVYASVCVVRCARRMPIALLKRLGGVLANKKVVPVWQCILKFVVNYATLVLFAVFVYALLWVPFALVSLTLYA